MSVTASDPGLAAPLPGLGTLLWIGPSAAEFREAARCCEGRFPQLARRRDLAEAVRRPAQEVSHLVLVRRGRESFPETELAILRQRHPQGRWIQLLGSGCEGELRSGRPWSGAPRVYWHQWNVWAASDGDFGGPQSARPSGTRSAAIVSATHAIALPLLELFDEAQANAYWVRPEAQAAVRGARLVLWDDSAAAPCSADRWRQRCQRIGSGGRHVWLASMPRIEAVEAARQGGIDQVISKPYPVEAILELVRR